MEAAVAEVAFSGHLENGHRPPKTKRSTVAIVGFAPSSMMLAPYDDPAVEIWGINELYLRAPRIDRLFELHEYKYLTKKQRNPHHLEWLRQATVPIYTFKRYRDIPTSIPFPFAQLTSRFDSKYFTNSISWLIAFAIVEGFKRIELWGVDMAMVEEYGSQRPSCEYWVGMARGMGIDVFVPDESNLLKSWHLYGKEEAATSEMRTKMQARKSELLAKLKQVQDQRDTLTLQEHTISGNLSEVDYIIKTFVPEGGE